jgi:ribA/ribD-fused uncharacterized protein
MQEAAKPGDRWVETGYVFTNPFGQPLNPDYLTRRFCCLVRQSGLPPVRLHDLRHGAATLAHAAGADLKTVQEQLSHTSIVLTADTYTGVLMTLHFKIAEATARLVLAAAARNPGRRHHTRPQMGPTASAATKGGTGPEPVRPRFSRRPHPHAAKALGRRVAGFDEQVWDEHRYNIVVAGNLVKFSQYPQLCTFLLATGERILVEASPVDRLWGIGLGRDDPAVADPARWRGLNLLGFALMQVRAQLRERELAGG